MKRGLLFIVLVTVASLALFFNGCDKEKIVQSTEYVHDIKYIESPPDTVFSFDTVLHHDTITFRTTDTLREVDTVIQMKEVHDTVRTTVTIHDTVRTSVLVHDTVTAIRYHYDTLVVIDTVVRTQCSASAITAIAAMQYYTDEAVLQYAHEQYGLNDGYIFYLSSNQLYVSQVSSKVFDIYGYLEFYSTDWSQSSALEFYWRLTYSSGDPNDPNNWGMSDPPSAVSGYQPGIRATSEKSLARPIQR
jgi:hypothetical protein